MAPPWSEVSCQPIPKQRALVSNISLSEITNIKSLNPTDPNNVISNARNISRNKNMTFNRNNLGPQRTGDVFGFFGMIFEAYRRRFPNADDRGMSSMLLPIRRHDHRSCCRRFALGLSIRSIPILMRRVWRGEMRVSRIHPWMTRKLYLDFKKHIILEANDAAPTVYACKCIEKIAPPSNVTV